MTTIDDIRERLTEIRAAGFPRDIVALGMVRGIDKQDGVVTIHLQPPAMPPQSLNATLADIRRAVGAMQDVSNVEIRVEQTAPGAAAAPGPFSELGPLPGVRDIIAVASTKGGVGKSTVAANLALALAGMQRRVGLMDADVYGPSVPIMFGTSGRPHVAENKRIAPHEKFGLRLMSIGFFLDDESPVIWRGPLVMGLVRQFLKDVDWGELDILVVDMPPGTGDAQLTLVQQVPLAGGVVVTTPQDVATLDVQRGIAMFQQVNTPVLGIIENMSYYECPKCGKREDLFGSGGGERIAARFGVPVLGRIPLVSDVRTSGDAGKPIVIDQPHHPVSRLFVQIAGRVLEAIEVERLAAPAPTIIG
jgi:ATP-binding protein involved in chromosome partitioning